MFDTKQMEYILAIAETKSIKLAAEKMFVTANALYQQLEKLEQEGLPPLFVHSGGEMLLTDAGKIYVNGVKTVLQIRSDTMERIQNPTGNVHSFVQISTISTLSRELCRDIMPAFKNVYPHVQLSIKTLNYAEEQRLLSSHQMALSICGLEQGARVPFHYTKLCSKELVLFGLAEQDCSHLPVVLPPLNSNLNHLACRALEANSPNLPVMAFCNHKDGIFDVVRSGRCVAVADRDAVEAVEDMQILPWEIPFYYDLVALYPSEEALSPPVAYLLKLITAHWGNPGA